MSVVYVLLKLVCFGDEMMGISLEVGLRGMAV